MSKHFQSSIFILPGFIWTQLTGAIFSPPDAIHSTKSGKCRRNSTANQSLCSGKMARQAFVQSTKSSKTSGTSELVEYTLFPPRSHWGSKGTPLSYEKDINFEINKAEGEASPFSNRRHVLKLTPNCSAMTFCPIPNLFLISLSRLPRAIACSLANVFSVDIAPSWT